MTDMPERIARLPRRGPLPVPPIFGVDKNGVADFTVLDTDQWIEFIRTGKCHICGEDLDATMHFIGGPRSIENKAFTDGPMHHECATYSLAVCPFLAQGKTYATRPAREGTGGRGNMPTSGNPGLFGLLATDGFALFPVGDGVAIIANDPTDIEWWKNGEKL